MIIWMQVALALLKVVGLILDNTRYERAKQAGIDEEVARESAKVMQKTEFGKRALEDFASKPGSADDFLRQLEPK